jgi:hypothetical protein
MQKHATTASPEPDKPANGLLWIAVIYPLFIAILSVTCQSRMSSVIESIPIIENATSDTGGEHAATGEKAASLVDKDGDSPKEDEDEDEDAAKPAPSLEATQTPSKTSGPDRKHSLSNTEASLQSNTEAEKQASSTGIYKSPLVQASILHTLVTLMTHRLGILATRYVQETKHPGEKFIVVIAMAVATFLALLSGGKVELGRALSAQGFREADESRPPLDRSDPLAVLIVLCFYSWLIPWVRLLIACFWTGH